MSDPGKGFVRGGNVPLYATIALIVMVIAAVVLVLLANPATTPSLPLVLGLFATTIPSLVAALFAERASRDIRNGVVVEKAKEGAKEALAEHVHALLAPHDHNDPSDAVLRAFPHEHPKEDSHG